MTTLINRPWFTDRPLFDRTRHIARVLAHHGLGVLLDQAGLRRLVPRAWRATDTGPPGTRRRSL